MTATPIPRTLALSVYGDLSTSVIRHRPRAGAGVKTRVLESASRDIAYGALRDALSAGRQAYVICPLVAERDDADEFEDVPGIERDDEGRDARTAQLHAVETEVERLRRVLGSGVRVEALHGRMPSRGKRTPLSGHFTRVRSRCSFPPPWSRWALTCRTPP